MVPTDRIEVIRNNFFEKLRKEEEEKKRKAQRLLMFIQCLCPHLVIGSMSRVSANGNQLVYCAWCGHGKLINVDKKSLFTRCFERIYRCFT
jgi:hypothetical protein